jgi:hypothetical protein
MIFAFVLVLVRSVDADFAGNFNPRLGVVRVAVLMTVSSVSRGQRFRAQHEDKHDVFKAKTRPRYFPGGPNCEENLNQHLLERDASRFQALRLRQIHRENTLLDSGRNLVGID